jgi:hypothetical protein
MLFSIWYYYYYYYYVIFVYFLYSHAPGLCVSSTACGVVFTSHEHEGQAAEKNTLIHLRK